MGRKELTCLDIMALDAQTAAWLVEDGGLIGAMRTVTGQAAFDSRFMRVPFKPVLGHIEMTGYAEGRLAFYQVLLLHRAVS